MTAQRLKVSVAVEEEIVLQDLPNLPTAFSYLFGLIYALNLKYPKDLRYTFETGFESGFHGTWYKPLCKGQISQKQTPPQVLDLELLTSKSSFLFLTLNAYVF